MALDVEGDGDLDLAEVNFGAANAVYLNDGTGIFTQVDPGGFGSAGWICFLTTLDANGDGLADLAGQRKNYLGSGTGSFSWFDAGDYTSTVFQYTTDIVAFDADGDGDDNLAIGGQPNEFFVNDGSGYFTRANTGTLTTRRRTPGHWPPSTPTAMAIPTWQPAGAGQRRCISTTARPGSPWPAAIRTGNGRSSSALPSPNTTQGRTGPTTHRNSAAGR